MAAERWIVFLVLAALGGGIYIMSSLVDDESLEKYGKSVAEYNAQHHETMMDAALHRAKRGQEDARVEVPGNKHVDGEMREGWEMPENDRAMGGRNGGGDVEAARRRRFIRDDINTEKSDLLYKVATAKARSADQQVVNENHDLEAARRMTFEVKHVNRDLNLLQDSAWIGQGIVEEDKDLKAARPITSEVQHVKSDSNLLQDSAWIGQGIVEEDSDLKTVRPITSEVQGFNRVPDLLQDSPWRSVGQVGGVDLKSASRRSIAQIKAKDQVVSSESRSAYEDETPQFFEVGRAEEKSPLATLAAEVSNSDEGINGEEEQIALQAELLTNRETDGSSSEESPEDYDYRESHVNPEIGKDQRKFTHLARHLLASDGDKKLITFNKGIDFLLGLMNSMFSLEGELSVPLPKLNKTFGHGIMQGLFEADHGFFKNPATLRRTGDVAIVKNGDSVGLEVALGLATLEAGYDHYDLKILKIHQNGTLDVSVAENSIKMKISLTYYPHCKVDVNYLELDQLGGIKVDITGLGAFQSMVTMLSKWLTDNFTDDFRVIVNHKLIEKAEKAVAREDICKYFPLSLL